MFTMIDQGGEGLAFHEANANGNEGLATLRNDEVDIEETQDVDGGYNVGYILNGEWLEYTVNISATGNYDLDVRVAKDGDGGIFHLEVDGVNVSGPITVPNTGGWQSWETVTVNDISLTLGEHVIRLAFDSDYMNLNYFQFNDVITAVSDYEDSPIGIFPNPFGAEGISIRYGGTFSYQITDLRGRLMETGQSSDATLAGKTLAPGTYILKIDQSVFKVIKE